MSPLSRISMTLAATAGFALPALASAQTVPVAGTYFTQEVRYGDLNLASAEGQEALDQRIGRAATKVCRAYDGASGALCRSRARHAAAPAVKVATLRATGQTFAAREAKAGAIIGN